MKTKFNINQYLINLVILIVTWGNLFRRSFNCDTLTHMLYPESDIMIRIECERYLSAALDYILYHIFGVTTATHTGITVFLSILLLALAVSCIQNCFLSKVQFNSVLEKLAFFAITNLLFVNVLFSEPLMFGECSLMFALAYLLAAAGVCFFTKKRYGMAFIMLFLSTMEYQVGVVFAAIIISAWIFIDNEYKFSVKTVREEIICGMVTFGSGILNLLSGKVLIKAGVLEELNKAAGMGDIWNKIYGCGENLISLLRNSRGLLPDVWLPLLIMIIACGITIFALIRKKISIWYYCLLVPGLICMIYVIAMAQQEIYLPPRIVFTFYTVQSMLLLIAFLFSTGKIKQWLCYVCCGYLIIQIMFSGIILANREASNTLDEVYAMMVYEQILDYEEESGIKVNGLSVVNDIDCPFSYNEVHYKTDQINERAIGTVTNTLVNVMTGRNFRKVPMDEDIYKTYFEGKNWNYFNASEQLIIKGDTAYWVIF